MNSPSPYIMAFLTALLAGSFSLIGLYVIASVQARQAINAKDLEYRTKTYSDFINKLNDKEALIPHLLNIGSLADNVITDGEIQAYEDHIAELVHQLPPQEAFWKLNSEFNLLRLHGDDVIERICTDILALLSLRDRDVDWTKYSEPIQTYYSRWRSVQDHGRDYGYVSMVSPDERLMVIMVGKLFGELVTHLRVRLAGH